MADTEMIRYLAQIYKLQTLVDGGIRLTLDLVEPIEKNTIIKVVFTIILYLIGMNIMSKPISLLNGDCLELLPQVETKSVDMILCDLPYGTTEIAWDKVIPFEPLWEQYKRIIKDNGAIVLFSAQPFTTDLINSNRKMFRYEIIWEKTTPSGFLNANKMPLRTHENIVVFYKKLPTYNPIYLIVKRNDIGRVRQAKEIRSKQYRDMGGVDWIETGKRFPTDVIKFSNWNGVSFGKSCKDATKHPTQKPVDLCEYLIRTYTNPGDTVLDNCMGSGTTGVACVNTERNFIGIEINEDYFSLAEKRINDEVKKHFEQKLLDNNLFFQD